MDIRNNFRFPAELLAIVSIIALSFVLYYPSINYYFFQDDWFVLNWVISGKFSSFFDFRPDTIYWRPLSMPILFYSLYKIFGLNAFAFHIFSFILFFLSIVAVYYLLKEFLKKKIALFATFLYSTAPIHFMSLSWISTTSYIMSTLFQVLSFLFFIKFVQEKNKIMFLSSYVFFVLALLSHEFSVIFPLIMFVWLIYTKRNHFSSLIPYAILSTVFLIVRFIVFPLQIANTYKPVFNHLIIDNLIWYILWLLHFPESFKDLIDQSFIKTSLETLAMFWRTSIPLALNLVIFSVPAAIFVFKNIRFSLFAFSWLLIGLAPVLTIVNHSYSVYLSFAGLSVILLIAKSLQNTKTKLLLLLTVIWILSAQSSLSFIRSTHWISNEQKISRVYKEYVVREVKKPEPSSIFIFRHPVNKFSEENNILLVDKGNILEQSLNRNDAVQIIFDDRSLQSLFLEGALEPKLPANVKTYDITPR